MITHFQHPEFLWLLLLIPVYGIILFLLRKKRAAVSVSVFDDLKASQGWSYARAWPWLERIFIVVIIALFSLTLAYPQGSHETHTESKKGIDMVFALDVSDSMLAEDLTPNRIEAAKAALGKFTQKQEGDRMGVVVFSGAPFTQSPLTFDYGILEEYIGRISVKSINKNIRGLSGTAVGDAILAGVNRFAESGEREKVLVLLTDGDANVGVDPKIAAQKAAQEGVRIYTIGIGKEGGAPLKTTDMRGNAVYARNPDGSLYQATFNEEALKEVAQIGGGQYFRVDDAATFDTVLKEIAQLEKRDISVDVQVEYSDKFMPFLYALYLSMLLFVLLRSIKPLFV